MIKKIILSILLVIIITSCSINKEIKKFSLNDKYYNNAGFVAIQSEELPKKDSYILYTYNNYCLLAIPCDTIFTAFMEKYNISFVSIPFEEFKKTSYYKTVKYAPSIIIIKKGKIIAYLDADSDEDLAKYQDVNEFESWLDKYIYFEK